MREPKPNDFGTEYDIARAEEAEESEYQARRDACNTSSYWVDRLDGVEGTREVADFLAACMLCLDAAIQGRTKPQEQIASSVIIAALSKLRSKAVNGGQDV